MDFTLSKQHLLLRDMYRAFAENEVKPLAEEVDEEERFPMETVKKLARYGFMGIPFPKKYGGAGGDVLAYAMAVEELSKACATTGVIVSAHTSLCCAPIYENGTEEQKMQYLPKLLSGEWIGAFGLTEPNAGTDASGQQTTAELVDDHYVLNGTKIFITNAGYAHVYIIFAMTDKKAGNKGISAFIVEKDFPGFSVGKKEKKMGIRGSATCELSFDNIKLPADALVGKEGAGFKIAMMALDGARISIGAIASGLAQHAMEVAKNYANERVTFGKPIAKYQGVAFKFADMAAKIRAIDLMVWDTAQMKSEGQRHTVEAAELKLMSSRWCCEICDECIQVLGGNGYSREFHVERFYRDAKLLEIGEGTSEIQRMVISGAVLAK